MEADIVLTVLATLHNGLSRVVFDHELLDSLAKVRFKAIKLAHDHICNLLQTTLLKVQVREIDIHCCKIVKLHHSSLVHIVESTHGAGGFRTIAVVHKVR